MQARTPPGPLTHDELAALVAQDLTVREIAARVGRSPTTVRAWLTFHGLRTSAAARRGARGADASLRSCARHGEGRHVRYGERWRCARCASEDVSEHRRRVKRLLVDEAGGSCSLCGYDRCLAALQFHHVDPAEKRFALSVKGLSRAVAVLREEAEKCVLVCANCHAEIEAGLHDRLGADGHGRG